MYTATHPCAQISSCSSPEVSSFMEVTRLMKEPSRNQRLNIRTRVLQKSGNWKNNINIWAHLEFEGNNTSQRPSGILTTVHKPGTWDPRRPADRQTLDETNRPMDFRGDRHPPSSTFLSPCGAPTDFRTGTAASTLQYLDSSTTRSGLSNGCSMWFNAESGSPLMKTVFGWEQTFYSGPGRGVRGFIWAQDHSN